MLYFIHSPFYYDYKPTLIYHKEVTKNTQRTNEPRISVAFQNTFMLSKVQRETETDETTWEESEDGRSSKILI